MYEDEELEETISTPIVTEDDFDRNLRDLARLDSEVDRLESQVKQLKAQREALSYSLAQFMLKTGCSKKVLDGITYTQKQKVYSKVEDKEVLRNWIFEHGAVDLLMAVHPSKLTSYCNEQLENGGETPLGVNPNYIRYSVSVKK